MRPKLIVFYLFATWFVIETNNNNGNKRLRAENVLVKRKEKEIEKGRNLSEVCTEITNPPSMEIPELVLNILLDNYIRKVTSSKYFVYTYKNHLKNTRHVFHFLQLG